MNTWVEKAIVKFEKLANEMNIDLTGYRTYNPLSFEGFAKFMVTADTIDGLYLIDKNYNIYKYDRKLDKYNKIK